MTSSASKQLSDCDFTQNDNIFHSIPVWSTGVLKSLQLCSASKMFIPKGLYALDAHSHSTAINDFIKQSIMIFYVTERSKKAHGGSGHQDGKGDSQLKKFQLMGLVAGKFRAR